MAGRIFSGVQALQKEVKLMFASASFALGVPTLANNLVLASATKSATGQIDLVFQDSFPAFLGLSAVLVSTTAKDVEVQIKSISLSTKTIVIYTLVDGVATDLVAGDSVYFEFKFKNSTI